ncbi:protein ABHD16A-like [Pomacea canaliculata]|uniref:protein ABHD16A-like n=1 Tax=Pomacea canaliculata TaxID=400727 RepID=UPI000D737546|nr:protein ABHD16A-like [Pomacea canaliculata]
MGTYWLALKGPRLIRLLKCDNNEGRDYIPNILEAGGDKVLRVLHTCLSISWWSSPVIMTVLYRRGYFNQEGLTSIGKFLCSISLVYIGAFCLRGVGRLCSADYMVFINVLAQAMTFTIFKQQGMILNSGPGQWIFGGMKDQKGTPSLIVKVLGYLAIHTFGRRMVYPGATSLMQMLLGNMLNQGRAQLIEQKHGYRAKLLAEDNNEIDTMFLDRRGSAGVNGKTLVICFEGNAGFYEMGSSGTAIDCGFSVLGWNHPGFAGSTGVPFPDAEQKAVDVVMQYAINKLDFSPENIVLFAWSIGGYSASWAAMSYPEVKYVILDATFDDIVPLAVKTMPQSWSPLVKSALRNYMNLNVSEQLIKYPGPVKLIRRLKDEVISALNPNSMMPVLSTNRGNFLLIQLLKYRYPMIVDNSTVPLLEQWLAASRGDQDNILMEHSVDMEQCAEEFRYYLQGPFPCLPYGNRPAAKKYLEDFDSSHCTPLPPEYFRQPWSPGYQQSARTPAHQLCTWQDTAHIGHLGKEDQESKLIQRKRHL